MSLQYGSLSKLPLKPLTQLSTNPIMSKQQPNSNIQAPMSKLHQYFASSQYLSSQEELSIFIENFPLIDIEGSHKSINQILPLLIKQNQLLSKKCQSQVLLIKQSFAKHQAMNKQNKKVKEEIETLQRQCQQVVTYKNSQIIEALKRNDFLAQKLQIYEGFIHSQNLLFKNILANEYKKCEELMNSRSTRVAYENFLSMYELQSKSEQTSKIMKKQQLESELMKRTEQIVSLQQVERFCKQERRRNKYYQRVRSCVEDFCLRLVKITTMVPIEMVSKELSHECGQFLDIIGEMIGTAEGQGRKKIEESVNNRREKQREKSGQGNRQKKEKAQRQSIRKGKQSGEKQIHKSREQKKLKSVNSESSLMSKSELEGQTSSYKEIKKLQSVSSLNSNYGRNYNDRGNAKEAGMLERLMRDKQSTVSVRSQNLSSFQNILSTFINESTQKYQNTIQMLESELEEVKQQLQTSKNYYEQYLINAKMQYETRIRSNEEQLAIKEETSKHFEQELTKCFSLKEELQNRMALVTNENDEMKKRQNPLKEQINTLTEQLQQKQHSLTKTKLDKTSLQQSLSQKLSKKQQQLTEATLKLEAKIKTKSQQFQQQLSKKQHSIRAHQQQLTQLNHDLRQAKELIEDKNVEIARITKRLHLIEQDQVQKLESQITHIEKQISNTKSTNLQLTNTIHELQQELSLNNAYHQQLESKALKQQDTIEKLNKKLSNSELQNKSLKHLQTTNTKLQTQLESMTIELKKTSEDNSSLKKLVKEMKKELEEVYKTINDLKSIEKDREKLVLQNQKSERWKQQIMKDYDQMKYEILKVQAQNNSLTLELRHYKNALKRIQMIN